MPRSGEVRVSRGSALGEAVVLAVEGEEQGRVKELCSQTFDLAGLFEAASGLAPGSRVRVRPMAPLMYRMLRPFLRGPDRGAPQVLQLAQQLLSQAGHPPSLQVASS